MVAMPLQSYKKLVFVTRLGEPRPFCREEHLTTLVGFRKKAKTTDVV
jgi:hypothetical protein